MFFMVIDLRLFYTTETSPPKQTLNDGASTVSLHVILSALVLFSYLLLFKLLDIAIPEDRETASHRAIWSIECNFGYTECSRRSTVHVML